MAIAMLARQAGPLLAHTVQANCDCFKRHSRLNDIKAGYGLAAYTAGGSQTMTEWDAFRWRLMLVRRTPFAGACHIVV